MKRILAPLGLGFIIAIFAIPAFSQNVASPEKRRLLGELITVMKMDKQLPQMMDTLLQMSDTFYEAGVKQLLDKDTRLSAAEKEQVQKSLTEKSRAFSQKFRDRLPSALNYAEYIGQTVYPVYDKAFTEKELADIVSFYKSETGQKMLVSMPQLMADSIESAQRLLLPKVTKLVDEIIAEEMADPKAPPRPKTN